MGLSLAARASQPVELARWLVEASSIGAGPRTFRAGRASWHGGLSRQARLGLPREAFRAGRASWHGRLSSPARSGLPREAHRAGRASWHGPSSSQARAPSSFVSFPVQPAPFGNGSCEASSSTGQSRLARNAFRAGRASWNAGVSRQARSRLARQAIWSGRASWHGPSSRQARARFPQACKHRWAISILIYK